MIASDNRTGEYYTPCDPSPKYHEKPSHVPSVEGIHQDARGLASRGRVQLLTLTFMNQVYYVSFKGYSTLKSLRFYFKGEILETNIFSSLWLDKETLVLCVRMCWECRDVRSGLNTTTWTRCLRFSIRFAVFLGSSLRINQDFVFHDLLSVLKFITCFFFLHENYHGLM